MRKYACTEIQDSQARDLRDVFPAMADPASPKLNLPDAEQLARLLDLELIQKRATWKQAGERYRAFRTLGFVFLALLILACLVGGYFAFMRVSEQRTNQPNVSDTPDR